MYYADVPAYLLHATLWKISHSVKGWHYGNWYVSAQEPTDVYVVYEWVPGAPGQQRCGGLDGKMEGLGFTEMNETMKYRWGEATSQYRQAPQPTQF